MSRLLSIALLALLMIGPISAFACEDADDTKILFGSPARDRERDNDDCLDNGLNPGSYFDSKGRIVGSPCDPEQYCSDPSSEDIAVVDYCSDTWDDLGINRHKPSPVESEGDWDKFCEENPNVIPCSQNDIPTPEPTPEPEPVYDCTSSEQPWCVPVDDDNEEEEQEEEEEEPTPEENHHNTDVHDEPE